MSDKPGHFILLPEPHPSRMLARKALEAADDGMEILIQWPKKQRKVSLNDAMWAGPLRDIERQAWFAGRQYSAEMWNIYFKEKYLPDENDPEFDPSHVVEGYQKWQYGPSGRILKASTPNLTDKGMRAYLLAMEAEAAQEFQVTFTEASEPCGRFRG